MTAFNDLLSLYLAPFALAVPFALLLFLLVWRYRDSSHTKAEDIATASGVAGSAPPGPPSILVVDDSPVVRAKLRKLLEPSGYTVLQAVDGVEALELMANHHVAVLITDLEMPRMNGFELIESVKGALDTEDLPILAITGHEELHARVHQMEGLYGLFKKPWSDRELLKRVAALVTVRPPPSPWSQAAKVKP